MLIPQSIPWKKSRVDSGVISLDSFSLSVSLSKIMFKCLASGYWRPLGQPEPKVRPGISKPGIYNPLL